MVEVTPYVSPCNKEEEGKVKKLHLRISKPHTVSTEEVAEELSHSTTLTPTEVAGVLTALHGYIIHALGEGRSVNLAGLGRISLIPHFKKPVYEGDKFRNEDVGTKGVQFLPDRKFIDKVRYNTLYRAGKLHKAKDVTLEEARAFCEEWFEEHEVLITADLMRGLEVKRGKARSLLNALVAEGMMEKKRYGSIMQFRAAER